MQSEEFCHRNSGKLIQSSNNPARLVEFSSNFSIRNCLRDVIWQSSHAAKLLLFLLRITVLWLGHSLYAEMHWRDLICLDLQRRNCKWTHWLTSWPVALTHPETHRSSNKRHLQLWAILGQETENWHLYGTNGASGNKEVRFLEYSPVSSFNYSLPKRSQILKSLCSGMTGYFSVLYKLK
jgi:hypothetical protein